MNRRKFYEIWIEQCQAAREIRLRYGLKAAFDYLVAEKLLNFADAAAADPEFARELPRFVARQRLVYTARNTDPPRSDRARTVGIRRRHRGRWVRRGRRLDHRKSRGSSRRAGTATW